MQLVTQLTEPSAQQRVDGMSMQIADMAEFSRELDRHLKLACVILIIGAAAGMAIAAAIVTYVFPALIALQIGGAA